MKFYKLAPECAEVGASVIQRHHPILMDVPVLFVFVSEPDKVKGQVALATARKVSAKEIPLLVLAARNAGQELHGQPGFDSCGFGEDKDGWLMVESLTGDGFLITVWEKAWQKLSDHQRAALIDHELCHCEIVEDEKGNPKSTIIGHDIEEFQSVVRRHGNWLPHISDFVEACKAGQERFNFDDQKVEVTT